MTNTFRPQLRLKIKYKEYFIYIAHSATEISASFQRKAAGVGLLAGPSEIGRVVPIDCVM